MPHRQLELVVRRAGQLDRRMPLRAGILSLGRGDMNDIVLPDIGVSRRHARLHVGQDAVMVEDAGSGNGTWFRGQRVNRQILGPGDEVVIDPFALSFENVGADEPGESTEQQDSTQKSPNTRTAARLTVVSGHRVDKRDYPLPQMGTFTMGRSEKNLIVLPEPAASRVHAEIVCNGDSYALRDMGSSNGTFVNGRRIREAVLGDGDRIRIGSFELRFSSITLEDREEPTEATEAYSEVLHTDTAAQAQPAPEPPTPAPPPTRPPPAEPPPLMPGQPILRPVPNPGVYINPELVERPSQVRRRSSTPFWAPLAAVAALGFLAFAVFLLGVIVWQLYTRTPTPSAPPASPTATSTASPEVRSLTDQGVKLIQEHKPQEAAAKLFAARELAPSDAEAERLSYVACEGIVFGAMREMLTAKDASASKRAAAKQAALDAVDAAMAGTGATSTAKARLVEALTLNPDDKDLVAARSKIDGRAADRTADAAKVQEARSSGSMQGLYDSGKQYFAEGKWARAISAWEQVAEADRGSLGNQAKTGITQAKSVMKAEASGSWSAAQRAIAAEEWGDARTQLQKTLSLDPYNDDARAQLTQVRGKLKGAARSLAEQARQAEADGKNDKAIGLYQKVISYIVDESDPLVQDARSRIAELSGR